MARFEFKDPPLLTDEEISEVLARADDLAAWANNVREYALSAALSGRKIAGWKVVEGRGSRRFTDDAAAAARLEAAGVEAYERKMLGVSAIEKKLGRKDFRNLLGDLVVRQEGKPTLAPEDDKRPEMNLACVDFAMTDDGDDAEE